MTLRERLKAILGSALLIHPGVYGSDIRDHAQAALGLLDEIESENERYSDALERIVHDAYVTDPQAVARHALRTRPTSPTGSLEPWHPRKREKGEA